MRGVLTATLLYRLEGAFPGWLNSIDLIAGTSSGGMIALGLAHCQNPGRVVDVMVSSAPVIFQDSIWDNIKDLGCLLGAQYSNRNLKAILKHEFGHARLRDLHTQVLISAFDLDPGDFRRFMGLAGQLVYQISHDPPQNFMLDKIQI